MTIENRPSLELPDLGNVCDVSRPVLSYGWEADGPHTAAAHTHPRAHIIQILEGAYWIKTEGGMWLVPKGWAVWIAPFVFHEVYSPGRVRARVLFVDQAFAANLPPRCGALPVPPLLAELLGRCVQLGNDYDEGGATARLAMVMLDELSSLQFAPLLVPVCDEPRLAKIMNGILAEPGCDISVEALAASASCSLRTFSRLFRSHTGMSFGQWRTNLRMFEAIERLSRGQPVTQIAFDLGYASPAAFTYAFRKNIGMAPSNYLNRRSNS